MNRDDAVWYYRLGGQTLGPVAWPEIEQLTRDTVDADQLLVARGGDAQWLKASEAVAAYPELAVTPAEWPAAEAPVAAPPEEWNLIDESEEATPAPAGWEPAQTQPSAAASEVLGTAATERDAGRPSPRVATPPQHMRGMPVKSDLGGWIG